MPHWQPNPPALGDKLVDWEIFAAVGGEDLVRGLDVLDVGPENGLDALVFATKARRYVCVDNSPLVLDRVERTAPAAELCSADLMARWPFDDGSFDLVLDFSTLDDTPCPIDGYAQALRVLRSGGTLVSTYANAIVIGGRTQPSALQEGKVYTASVPEELASFFTNIGASVIWRGRESLPRAGIVVRKR